MKNIPYSYQQKSKQYPVEIVTTEITDLSSNNQLPRHIRTLESPSHRGYKHFGQINHKPRVCKIDPKPFTNPFSSESLAWYIAKEPVSTVN
ncbi:hypothetical protein NIES4102_27720 [Chondrocystis sp. NIES-4102]|nr:hypothetical protein NIES4102_27720 [Chondrocystis sp. NIES-4102]